MESMKEEGEIHLLLPKFCPRLPVPTEAKGRGPDEAVPEVGLLVHRAGGEGRRTGLEKQGASSQHVGRGDSN